MANIGRREAAAKSKEETWRLRRPSCVVERERCPVSIVCAKHPPQTGLTPWIPPNSIRFFDNKSSETGKLIIKCR